MGYIGRNAAGYLVDELKAVKFAELHSSHFPPVVLINPEKKGEIIGLKNEFYYWKAKKKGQRDLIILIGDSQSMDPTGHYEIANCILDVLEEFKVKDMITIGGFSTGTLKEKVSSVFGAGVDIKKINEFEKLGVKFSNTNIGQIIGASGLLISLGERRGIKGVCLMGETSGVLLSDPKATEAVLEVISKYLKIRIDMKKIQQRVKSLEKVVHKIEDLQTKLMAGPVKKKGKEEFGYIG
jgi:uncharacterized protein (TIGR00162 family)